MENIRKEIMTDSEREDCLNFNPDEILSKYEEYKIEIKQEEIFYKYLEKLKSRSKNLHNHILEVMYDYVRLTQEEA